jgi:hypothetical protein
MKLRSVLASSALAAIVMLTAGQVYAQNGFSVNISVDEFGNGRLTNSSGVDVALVSGLRNDPGPGGLNNVLTYDLFAPPGLTAGDVILTEPGTTALSDVIRFNPNQVGPGGREGTLVFYSDNIGGFDAPADTISPPNPFYTNTVTLSEVGPESGPNGIVYTPVAGQPGFVTGAAGPVTYTIISDPSPVPEPSTLALGMIGSLAGLGYAWRRRKASHA